MYQPLADKIRPLELDDMVGQQHIIGEGGLLRRILESGHIPNMIFYGPSGVGKTTLAQIIANKTDRRLVKLNATTASTADIKGVDIWVNFTETDRGVLCELRSSKYNINPIAVKYGGGGHQKASGASVANYEVAMEMLRDLDALEENAE